MSKKAKDESLWIKRMVNACRKIRGYTSAVSKEEFLKGEVDYDAVCMQLIHLAEQAHKVLTDTSGKLLILDFENIPWNDIARQRHKVAHWYESAKPERIWATATADILLLEDDLMQILKTRFGTDDSSIDE